MYQFANRKSSLITKAMFLTDPLRTLEIGGGKGEEEKYSSTFFWASHSRQVVSISENPETTKGLKEACKNNGLHNIRAITSSVAKWLPNHYGKFDVLYMDEWGPKNEHRQNNYLEAYRLLRNRLGNSSIIIIDGTAKFSLAVEEAKNDGWRIMEQDHQVLLARKMPFTAE